MGGRAFISGPNPLKVIRMTPSYYASLRSHYLDRLSGIYEITVAPSEAPEKVDHGDIEILVAGPPGDHSPHILKVGLGAEEYVKSGGGITSFAIPLDHDCDTYFQLDVHLCKHESLNWEIMIGSYGDLWRILGATVTRYELSIKNTGFYLHHPETKSISVFLTDNSHLMMEFFGLDPNRYEEGFKTLDELFHWATSCSLFKKKFFEKHIVSDKEQRAREKRPMYVKFVTEWLPKHDLSSSPDNGDDDEKELRQRNTSEAIERFRKQDKYEEILAHHQQEVLNTSIWRHIANGLPLVGKELGLVLVALKERLSWTEKDRPFLASGADGPDRILMSTSLVQSQVDEIIRWTLDHYAEIH